MKNLLLFVLFASSTASLLIGQVTWERTPGPYAGNVNSIVEDHEGNLYAGTWLGGMYRMLAGDSSWTHLEERLNFGGIWDFKVSDDNVIYAASNSGIYHSSDQGESWILGYEGMSRSFCRSVGIYNADTIFAGNNSGGVFRSDDGGMTWTQKSDSIGDAQVWVIVVTDAEEIWVGTNNAGIFRSIDRGETWEERNNGLRDLSIRDILWSDSSLFAATFNGLHRSKDNGLNWERIITGSFLALAQDDEGTIYTAYNNNLVVSKDQFDTFEEYPYAEFTRSVSDILYTSDDKLLITSYGNGIFQLTDSFLLNPMNPGLTNVDISSVVTYDMENLLVGSNNGIFKSQDEGQTWIRAENGLSHNNIEVLAIANDTLFLAGTNNSGLNLSADGGASWFQPESELANKILSATSTPDGHLFAGSGFGEIFRSMDGGNNWVKLDGDFPSAEVDVLGASNQGYIYAGLLGIGVYRSMDNGESWILINNGLPDNYRPKKFIFEGDSTIWVGGHAGVYRSIDLGDTWEGMNFGFQTNDIVMDVEGNVYAGTRGSGVYQLESGNSIWERINDGLNHLDISSLAFLSENVLFAGSAGGGLFKTTIERSTTPVAIEEIPDGFSLASNSPNPFRETTVIRYHLPESGSVMLKVHDMMGKEVATILNYPNQTAGQHTITWNVSNDRSDLLTSGMYVLTLSYQGRYTISNRMIIY